MKGMGKRRDTNDAEQMEVFDLLKHNITGLSVHAENEKIKTGKVRVVPVTPY